MILPPLIVTAKMDNRSAEYYTDLRRRWFPPERNFLKAHITLFHQLPFETGVLHELNTFTHPPFECADLTWGRLGNGFCVRITCGHLNRMHSELSELFSRQLIPQDRQTYRPHITIQNKVEPEIATRDYACISSEVALVPLTITGLQIWVYRQGPWELLGATSFTG